jgi:hypothetical protein
MKIIRTEAFKTENPFKGHADFIPAVLAGAARAPSASAESAKRRATPFAPTRFACSRRGVALHTGVLVEGLRRGVSVEEPEAAVHAAEDFPGSRTEADDEAIRTCGAAW